jgi:hypothetical protein
MRRAMVYTTLAMTLWPLCAAAQAPGFDGMWQTTVSCAAARDALGYSFRFVSTVKNGVLQGVHGTVGQPSSLQIDGKIGSDGAARLYATGRTGSKEFVPGTDTPRGTEYSYSIDAHFQGTAGTGTRVEGRPCTLQFQKQ